MHASDSLTTAHDDHLGTPTLSSMGIREVVIVDPCFDRYGDFVAAARAGNVGLHFCADGRSAIRLARRFRADVWLVSDQLPDVSGLDLVEMLASPVMQAEVDPMLPGSPVSLDRLGRSMRSGIFVVADEYRIEDEQRALAAGVSGYLVRPVTIDVVVAMRSPAERLAGTSAA